MTLNLSIAMVEGGIVKILKLSFKRSIFSRLVVTFLIIMIPIYMLGIYLYNWGLRTIKGEISKSTIAQVSFYLQDLEKEIERIKILQYDCLNDEYLNKLAIRWDVLSTYEKTESMRLLEQRLVIIKNSSRYIKNVSAHILPIKRTISTNRGVDDIDMERYQEIRVPQDIKGAQIINFKGGLFLSTSKQNYLPNYQPLYIIEIELNKEALRTALVQFNTYSESGSVLVNLLENDIITSDPDLSNILSNENTIVNLKREDSGGMEFVKIMGKGYYIVHSKSGYLNMALYRYIPEKFVSKPLQNFYVWVWVFSIVTVLIMLIYSLSAYNFLHKPLLKLVSAFNKVESGDLQVSINHDSDNEFGYLYKRFNNMVRNLNMLIDQVYNQKILMQRAELKQLQSQINPHFLYNSLFMINTMARIGDENLITFTKHLGEYFRFVTRNSSDNIPLSDEVNHARVYTQIQLMRFSKRLQVEFAELPERYSKINVPRLILQPVIENAFEHGIEKKKSNGLLRIDFEGNEEELNIIIEDNGVDISDTVIEDLQKKLDFRGDGIETTGIINIHRRIRLVFGDKSGIQVSRSELGGFKVIMKIKIPSKNQIA
jgi:two-component system, sensor histidine kinase YesM